MTDLAERFAEVIDELEVPDTDLVDRVMAEVGGPVNLASLEPFRRQRVLVACAAAVLVALAVVTLEPARSAVADFFGFGAVRFDDERFEVESGERSTPSALTANETEPAVLEEVPVNPIQSLGQPVVTEKADSGRRTYSWPEVTLEVRPVDGPLEFKQRATEPGTEFIIFTSTFDGGGANEVDVSALWIPTAHQRILAEGEPAVTSGPTLLWVFDEIQYRLEGNLGRDDAIALARQVRGGADLLAEGS